MAFSRPGAPAPTMSANTTGTTTAPSAGRHVEGPVTRRSWEDPGSGEGFVKPTQDEGLQLCPCTPDQPHFIRVERVRRTAVDSLP